MTATVKPDPFSVARNALTFVGKFRTPPTPPVYEVWYRYVEANDDLLVDAMKHAVECRQEVSLDLLTSVHRAHCELPDPTSAKAVAELLNELANFSETIQQQRRAGEVFHDEVTGVSRILRQDASHQTDLQQCIHTLLTSNAQMHWHLGQVSESLQSTQAQLTSLREELDRAQRAAYTDHLTGIGNRKQYDRWAEQYIKAYGKDGQPIFLALVDLDHFKTINDQFGHSVGDMVITYAANLLQEICAQAKAARIGGDEFAVFFPAPSRQAASDLLNEMLGKLKTQPLVFGENNQSIGTLSFSVGAAHLDQHDDALEWFNKADRMLYSAKELGRNCAIVYRA